MTGSEAIELPFRAAGATASGTIVGMLDALAALAPAAPLYHFYDSRGRLAETASRGAFLRRSSGIARMLRQDAHVAAGDRVILAFPPGIELLAAFFGVMRAGAIPVPVPPLDQRAVRGRIDLIAADCGATLVLTAGAGHYPALPCRDTLTWADAEPVGAGPNADAGDIAFLQYTSGSTTQPRGVRVTHANLIANYAQTVDHMCPVAVSWLPQHHDMGLIGYCLYPALAGGTVHLLSPASFIARPALWLELMTRVKATASSAPNFAFDYLLDRVPVAARSGYDLRAMRFLMTAAEPVRPQTYARFLREMAPLGLDPAACYAAYGLAEATLAVTSYGRRSLAVMPGELGRGRAVEPTRVADIAHAQRIMSCGVPLGDTAIAIVPCDPGAGPGDALDQPVRPLADGHVGEIWLAGASVSPGYWNPAEDRGSFGNTLAGSRLPWLATGDMGFLWQGELMVCGRAKDVIIVRGQNIYPQDLEAHLGTALALREGNVAVVEAAGGMVVAIAEWARRTVPDLDRLVGGLRAETGVGVDRLLLVAPRTLPRTSSGKLKRHAIVALVENSTLAVVARWCKPDAAPDDARRFGWFLDRYRLNGTERLLLTDIGVDSLDLVNLLHEVQDLLAEHGADALAERVDARLLQRIAIADLLAMAEGLVEQPRLAAIKIGRIIAAAHTDLATADLRQMRADALAAVRAPAVSAAAPPTLNDGAILLTGATGFLGPFLLASLVQQSSAPIIALTRDRDAGEGRARILDGARASGLCADTVTAIAARLEIVSGDLARPELGLDPHDRAALTGRVATIVHNGALVNYLFDYTHLRMANVIGTSALVEFAAAGRPRTFNHISTTFVFGWATKPVLVESDENADGALLDFGYSQTKWSAERIVANAGRAGLPVRIFRPALITPAIDGGGSGYDITIRLLKFMIDHGVGVSAHNQVSFTPVDIVANNIVAIAGLPDTIGGTFHVVRDDYARMRDITDEIARQTGRSFAEFDIKAFVPEVISRATRDDILFPLIDFLVNSIDNISTMEFKRYDSRAYQQARNRSPQGRPDPTMADTVAGILSFMRRHRLR